MQYQIKTTLLTIKTAATDKRHEIMKAYKITSTEYRANIPSVFIFVNGEYFGDLCYPSLRQFPQNIEYWVNTTCADDDRYFNVKEIEISEKEVSDLAELHNALTENAKNILPYTGYVPNLTAKEKEADRQENIRRESLNAPFYKKAKEISDKINGIIETLK